MSDLRELYQEVILDHGRRPRNHQLPEDATRCVDGYNPLCGDRVRIGVTVDGETIRDVGFEGDGCAICMASTSTMTEAVKGQSASAAHALFEKFHDLVTGAEEAPDLDQLGKLAVFAGVSDYPMRVKCATLGWHTLEAALSGDQDEVTTE